MSNNRIYNRKEISRIMTKAAEIQGRKDFVEDTEGLSENEILAVAEEVGIDRDSILEALHTLDVPDTNMTFDWIRGTSSIQEMALIDGEIDDNKWEELLLSIRRATGGVGRPSQVGSTYEWEQKLKEVGHRHFSFTPQKNGKTRVQFASGWTPLKIMTMMFSAIGGGLLALFPMSYTNVADEVALAVLLCGALLAQPVGRYVLKTYFDKQKRMFKEVVQSLGKIMGLSKSAGAEKAEIAIDTDAHTADNQQKESASAANRIRS